MHAYQLLRQKQFQETRQACAWFKNNLIDSYFLGGFLVTLELLCSGQGSSVGLGHQELVTYGYLSAPNFILCIGEVTAARMDISAPG